MTDDLTDAPARTGGTKGDRDLVLSAAIVAVAAIVRPGSRLSADPLILQKIINGFSPARLINGDEQAVARVGKHH